MSEYRKIDRHEFIQRYEERMAMRARDEAYARRVAETAWCRYMQDKETRRLRIRKKFSKAGAQQ